MTTPACGHIVVCDVFVSKSFGPRAGDPKRAPPKGGQSAGSALMFQAATMTPRHRIRRRCHGSHRVAGDDLLDSTGFLGGSFFGKIGSEGYLPFRVDGSPVAQTRHTHHFDMTTTPGYGHFPVRDVLVSSAFGPHPRDPVRAPPRGAPGVEDALMIQIATMSPRQRICHRPHDGFVSFSGGFVVVAVLCLEAIETPPEVAERRGWLVTRLVGQRLTRPSPLAWSCESLRSFGHGSLDNNPWNDPCSCSTIRVSSCVLLLRLPHIPAPPAPSAHAEDVAAYMTS
ncbi:hypothetical protein MRX96_013805 [Rhipicephalus microplus]